MPAPLRWTWRWPRLSPSECSGGGPGGKVGKEFTWRSFMASWRLGMLAKGPVAPFLAALVIVLYAAAVRELRPGAEDALAAGHSSVLCDRPAVVFRGASAQPGFFREFILEHNLGRFSKNLYHHTEPFWYYLPVTALALVPWTVFVIAAFLERIRWWGKRKCGERSRS